ncbi:MAG: UDP-3-O-[3-hydroxymyristoyl] N-acetylglucosamine deacetylase [Candidatus Sumerlaeia bacterium]|nr:UDP-3-O-[3-hydroxymyristoyl] N-acetylglucosamine deacetylase [Candidatus Sumerlaeia bacterium]
MPERRRQRTLAGLARVRGQGVHTGEKTSVSIRPAEPGHGLVFRRTDLEGKPLIPATVESIVWSKLHNRTTLARGQAEVQTPEHLLSALAGLGVDNVLVDLTGPEVPGCDNSSLPFVEAIEEAGIEEQDAPLAPLSVDAPITVRDEESGAEVTAMPSTRFEVTFFAEFPEGYFLEPQTVHLQVTPKAYREQVAAARTWIFAEQIPGLLLRGLGKGGTRESVLVIGKSEFVTEPRMRDEAARHKALDLIGDLALVGRPLRAHVLARRSGHALHAKLVQQILAAAT